uniref:Uncharacterized protein n=1 Tax=Romanomermis culicivorax TaxID=13658 RepID=A0A915IN04_ROMCU
MQIFIIIGCCNVSQLLKFSSSDSVFELKSTDARVFSDKQENLYRFVERCDQKLPFTTIGRQTIAVIDAYAIADNLIEDKERTKVDN